MGLCSHLEGIGGAGSDVCQPDSDLDGKSNLPNPAMTKSTGFAALR